MRNEKYDNIADLFVRLMMCNCNEITITWSYDEELDLYVFEHNNLNFDADLEFQYIVKQIIASWFVPNKFENYKIVAKESA